MAISGKTISQTGPVVLDQNFTLPPNVVDVRYINESDMGGVSDTPVNDEEGTVIIVDGSEDDGGVTTPNVISAPTSMTILTQKVGIAPDGRFVVDVEIEVEDIPGVSTFEVRLTKA